jgi:hypothetical protein
MPDRPRDLDPAHRRPQGATDEEVDVAGKVSEALEYVERARGHLYSLHQLIGQADFLLGDAADLAERAGHTELADRLHTEIVGRNVLPGRWTFQIVEEFDEHYWSPLREAEQAVRHELTEGRRHVYEAELKQQRRTLGLPGHEATPEELP